jgi:hypothetical protein
MDGCCWRGIAGVLLAASAAAVPAADGSKPLAGQPSIVGAWEWTRKSNQCAERFDFRPDGTLQVASGERRTDSTYRLAWAPEPNGRYRLTLVVTRESGGRDCTGVDADRSGRQREMFVLFGQSHQTMIVCESPAGADCLGPLKRVAP